MAREAVSPVDATFSVGVDLGGTKVKAALVDAAGKILASHRHATEAARGAEAVVADVVECVRECLPTDEMSFGRLAIGVAGQVDRVTGVVRSAPNLGWRDFPLRERLEAALEVPVTVVNDVQAIAWGEFCYGAGRDVDDLLVVFVGTGIGGGVVSGGRLLRGDRGAAGELGHITIVADGRQCSCPNRGCLEAYVGGWAIAERASDAVRADAQAGRRLVELAGDPDSVTGRTVTRAYEENDLLAVRLVEETGDYLAAGLVGLVNAFNPSRLILGGGVVKGLPVLAERAAEVIERRALAVASEKLEIVTSQLGADAGVIGAAALARDGVG
jgi:glucokinase